MGLDIGSAYKNEIQCGSFIGQDLKNKVNQVSKEQTFFSILCDGSTNSAVLENEVTYALHFDPAPLQTAWK